MYFPDYIAGVVFMLGPLFVTLNVVFRYKKIHKQTGLQYTDLLFNEDNSQLVKKSMKGIMLINVFMLVLFLILAYATAIINQQ